MRVSSDKADMGFRYFSMLQANGKKVSVFLDGKEVKSCVTADDEMGFVARLVLDENGFAQVDPIDRTKVWEEQVSGDVEIRIEDAA